MALSFHNISGGGGWSQLRDTLRGYFVRYRLAPMAQDGFGARAGCAGTAHRAT